MFIHIHKVTTHTHTDAIDEANIKVNVHGDFSRSVYPLFVFLAKTGLLELGIVYVLFSC
jgi:hypothetical protein